jgi:hypothetical protein
VLFSLCLLIFNSFYASENTNLPDKALLISVQQSYLNNNREICTNGTVYFYDPLSKKVESFPYDENLQDKINPLSFKSQNGPIKNVLTSKDILPILKNNNTYIEYKNNFSELFISIDSFYENIQNTDYREECTQKILYYLRVFLHSAKKDQSKTQSHDHYCNFLQKSQKQIENLYKVDFRWLPDKFSFGLSMLTISFAWYEAAQFLAQCQDPEKICLPGAASSLVSIGSIPLIGLLGNNAFDHYIKYQARNNCLKVFARQQTMNNNSVLMANY